jgi:hypothetical protein
VGGGRSGWEELTAADAASSPHGAATPSATRTMTSGEPPPEVLPADLCPCSHLSAAVKVRGRGVLPQSRPLPRTVGRVSTGAAIPSRGATSFLPGGRPPEPDAVTRSAASPGAGFGESTTGSTGGGARRGGGEVLQVGRPGAPAAPGQPAGPAPDHRRTYSCAGLPTVPSDLRRVSSSIGSIARRKVSVE